MKPTRLRLSLKVTLVLAVILSAFALYLLLFSGRIRKSETSPDGKNVAECTEYGDQSTVQLRSRFSPFRHTVLSSLYDAGLTVTWIDSRNLLVRCQRCGEMSVIGATETQWHDISIQYAVH
jgi:hypothetical protein